ncbi:MAG: hypothetical protein QOG96_1208 [Pseudonocardiales bacterium]|jgi:uncharacterized protein (TIGR02246 family)|nr:hypothetical protein [Pseudonocardiales bacterium]
MTINADTSALAREDSAVRAVFGELSKAWATGDADAFAGWFTEEATAVLPGFYLSDKDPIRAGMSVAFAGPLRGSRRCHQVLSVRLLDAGTAIVTVTAPPRFRRGPGRPRSGGSGRRGS